MRAAGAVEDARARRDARVATARRTADRIGRRAARERLHRVASSRGSARSRCPARPTIASPFDFTAGTRDGGIDRSPMRSVPTAQSAQHVRQSRTDVQALSFSDNGDVTGDGRLRRLRHRRARRPGFRLRQLRDARREGQDRPRAALLPRGRRARRRRRFSPATPICATRRWPRVSTARRRCSSSPARARRTPARRFR